MHKRLASKVIKFSAIEEKDYILVNKFDFDSVRSFHSKFMLLNGDSSVIAIPIVITSYGGSVYALLAILDIMATATKPIATIALGAAMSCGSVLLSAGTKGFRFAGTNTDIMIHEVSSGEMGKLTELEAGVKEVKRLNKILMRQLAKNADKKDPDFFMKEMKSRTNLDWYLSAVDCKKLGLIDHVGIPEFVEG